MLNKSHSILLRFVLYTLLFASAGLFFSCTSAALRPRQPLSPIVRVGIVLNAQEIEFQPASEMTITPKTEDKKYRSKQTETWRVRVNKESVKNSPYRLLIGEFESKSKAKQASKKFEAKKIKTEIKKQGDELWFGGKLISGSSVFRLYVSQEFESREQAGKIKNAGTLLGDAQVVPGDDPLTGELILISPKGDELAVRDAVRLSETPFTIHNVQVGEGYHWSRQERRTYSGELEIRLNKEGNLVAVNVLPLEEYLLGVVPGEMPSSFPLEALKAQAIAARTYFLHNFNRVHRDDPFDVCADVHCQVYAGSDRKDDKIETAVRETRGLVLMHDEELCSTPFSAVCGGHTEHSDNVWSGDAVPWLRGTFDVERPDQIADKFDLSQETNVRTWIESLPDVFCNVEKNGSPAFAAYSKKYYRWEESFSRAELEQNIRNYTGQNFGALQDLRAKSRGVSGRIIELEVVGTSNSVTIGKELRIRKALTPTTLYSACIVFDKIGSSNGLPDTFLIKGAGWGHGVGMCQIGAAMMAQQKHDAGDILEHYYAGTRVRQLY